MTNEIFINLETYQKIFAYSQIAKKENDSEVGGFLQIQELDDGGLLIEDVVLPDQEVSCGSFEVTPDGPWVKTLKAEQISKLKGWWHSHHNMGTFHSGTDDTTLGHKWDGESKNSPNYAVSLVVALPNKMLCYLQYFKPIKTEKIEVPISVVYPESDDFYKKCEEEIKLRLKKWTYKSSAMGYDTHRGGGWQKNLDAEKSGESSKTKTFYNLDEDDEEDEETLEESIFDQQTGFSIAELKEAGLWDPLIYSDLAEELKEEMAKLEKASPKRHRKSKGLGTIVRSKEDQCPHLFWNQKGRRICHFKGRNYDCEGCKHNIPVLEKKHRESKSKDKDQSSPPIQPLVKTESKDLNTPSV